MSRGVHRSERDFGQRPGAEPRGLGASRRVPRGQRERNLRVDVSRKHAPAGQRLPTRVKEEVARLVKGAKSSAVSWSLRRVRSAEKERDTFFVDADCDPSDEECHYAF